jgi:hypothetical protein
VLQAVVLSLCCFGGSTEQQVYTRVESTFRQRLLDMPTERNVVGRVLERLRPFTSARATPLVSRGPPSGRLAGGIAAGWRGNGGLGGLDNSEYLVVHDAFKADMLELYARGTWQPSLPLQQGACRAVDAALGHLELLWSTLPVCEGAPSLEAVAAAEAATAAAAAASGGPLPPPIGGWPLLSPVGSRSRNSPPRGGRGRPRLTMSPRGRHGRYYLETTRGSWQPDARQFRWRSNDVVAARMRNVWRGPSRLNEVHQVRVWGCKGVFGVIHSSPDR